MSRSQYAIFATLLLTSVYCTKNVDKKVEKPLNILGIFPHEGLSHSFVFDPYLTELARRGHNVTVISHFPQKTPLKNFRDISLAGTLPISKGIMDITENTFLDTILMSFYLFKRGVVSCEVMLESKEVQALWKSKQKFDVIVYEVFNSDCALGLAHQFNAPTVAFSSCALLPMHYSRLGIPYNPSYVPVIVLGGGFKPNLFHRVKSLLAHTFFSTLYTYYQQPADEKILAKYFKNVPPLEELARETKFVFVNHNFPLTGSRLFPANVIEVGGVHVAEPKPLTGVSI